MSVWFDYATYMGNKLRQVQKADPAGNWDMTKVVKAFADSGFVGEVGAEAHFMQFGQFEDVAPNAFFNATEYYRAKAAEVTGKKPADVTDLDVANVQVAIKGLGMNAWAHYNAFGSSEGVNPSNQFDTDAYIAAKVKALNAVLADGQAEYTPEAVVAAFKAMGITALEHFMTFGGDATKGEVPFKFDGTIPAEFAVPEDKKVKPNNDAEGKTFVLTDKIDMITGTALNDTFIGDATTTQLGDQIDGGDGNDTFQFIGTGSGTGFTPPTLKNVENIILTNNASTDINVSNIQGLQTLTLDSHSIGAGATITLSGESVTVKNTNIGTGALDFTSATDTVLNLTLDGISSGTGTIEATGSKMKTMNLTLSGKDSEFNLGTGFTPTTINIDGKAAGSIDIAGATGITTIDAHANTGGIMIEGTLGAGITFTGGAGDDYITLGTGGTTKTIKMGAGNDTVEFIAANLGNITTVIDGGAGTDILETGTGGPTTFDKALVTELNKHFINFEVLSSAGTGAHVVKFDELGTYETVILEGAGTGGTGTVGTGGSGTGYVDGTAGKAVFDITFDSTDNLLVLGAAGTGLGGVGGAGGAGGTGDGAASNGSNGGHGGDGLYLHLATGAPNEVHIEFSADGDLTLLGGVGGAGGAAGGGTGGHGGNGGEGGHGLNAGTIETLYLNIESTDGGTGDTFTLTGGSGGAAGGTGTGTNPVAGDKGADGAGLVLADGGKLILTDSLSEAGNTYDNLTISSIKATATGVTIDGSKFHGVLTVTSLDGSDTLIGGAGDDVFVSGKGADILTGGAGKDKFSYSVLTDSLYSDTGTQMDTITDFTAEDAIVTSATFAKVSATVLKAAADATSLKVALQTVLSTAEGAVGAGKIGAFVWHDNTYVVINDATPAFEEGKDAVIQLTGVVDFTADNVTAS